MERSLRTNPRKFWKFVNEQRKETGLPTTMTLAGDEVDNSADICKLFATKLSSVFTDEILTDAHVREAANNTPFSGRNISSIIVDDDAILAALARLKNSCSPGPDGIPATLLKRCTPGLVAPLQHLFSLSLSSGRFPTAWKEGYLYPIHKKGARTDVANYRGITALCAVSKLFELVVYGPVFSHCRPSIADEQHGFLPKRSTATNILCFTGYTIDTFANRSQTDAIYTDMSAAFDKLNHRIAVAKLDRFGLSGSLLSWFESYLTGRVLTVRIGDESSDPFPATSGIAQGSHLGPLVYVLYSNDANNCVDGPRLAYADDFKLYSKIDSIADAEQLQRQLDSFVRWCELNRMELNPAKCSIVTYSRQRQPLSFDYRIGGTTIPRTDHIKDLGVILDSHLNFKQHISYIVAKASRQLGFVMRMTRDFHSIQCLTSLYCSLVRSSLEYCSVVWNPLYNNAAYRIECIQRRFVRYVLRLLPWRQPMRMTSYESRCQLLHLDTLQLRRDSARAMAVSDILTARIDCPEVLQQINIRAPSRSLRSFPSLHPPLRRTNYSANGAIAGLQRAFNKVASVFDFNLSRTVLRYKFVRLLRDLLYH